MKRVGISSLYTQGMNIGIWKPLGGWERVQYDLKLEKEKYPIGWKQKY